MLAQNLAAIEDRIGNACERAGRSRGDVTLVAVTKIFPAAAIEEAYALGVRHFGESYVQEFESKKPQLPALPDAVFHLIGHLQSNKAKKGAELFDVIETVDSPKLARRLDESGKKLKVMIEVKLSDEESKHGCAPGDVPAVIAAVQASGHLTLGGLMTIPPWTERAEESRPYFLRLREIAQAHGIAGLSMGMSNDFEVAIEEGATHVRVGTALFGSRKKL